MKRIFNAILVLMAPSFVFATNLSFDSYSAKATEDRFIYGLPRLEAEASVKNRGGRITVRAQGERGLKTSTTVTSNSHEPRPNFRCKELDTELSLRTNDQGYSLVQRLYGGEEEILMHDLTCRASSANPRDVNCSRNAGKVTYKLRSFRQHPSEFIVMTEEYFDGHLRSYDRIAFPINACQSD